ncbi:ALK and LTK ligand 1 isoform X3 [Betta splendens]|uniref:ALK and LTK ligand 1 isoform X3 n=1 Tax=Betta splendens TaxID=158456 RepID=A0A9W2XRD5_BETSP|nr:ALK and LTK ligand 1 isoform X3 [Betta splendens]
MMAGYFFLAFFSHCCFSSTFNEVIICRAVVARQLFPLHLELLRGISKIPSRPATVMDFHGSHGRSRRRSHKTWTPAKKSVDALTGSEVMQVERKWHILSTIFFLLITSGRCMDSKEVKPKERRTLLDLILQVIRDSQQREAHGSKRCNSGLLTSAHDMKFSSREKPLYVPRLDNSRLIEMAPRDVNMKGKFLQHFTET